MLRIEPLTDEHTIDVLFIASDDYLPHRETLRKYLSQEGFESIDSAFIIPYQGRLWHVNREGRRKRKCENKE